MAASAILDGYDADISYRIVSRFYTYMYQDTHLAKYFVGQDETKMKVRFRHFLASFARDSLFAPAEYMEKTHKGLGISDEEFVRFCNLLKTALLQEKVNPSDVDSICNGILVVRDHIVSR